MNILFVTGLDPRYNDFGSPQRNNRLWRALQQIGDVYTVCLYPEEGVLADRLIAAKPVDRTTGWRRFLNKVVNKFWFTVFPNARKYYPFPFDFSLDLSKAFSSSSEKNTSFRSEAFRSTAFRSEAFRTKFDLVVSRYIDPAITFHLWDIAPLYIDIDDHPLQALETRDIYEYPKWKRPLFAFIQRRIFHIVEKKMTGGWIANPEQVSWVKSKNPVLPLRNIPNYPKQGYETQQLRNFAQRNADATKRYHYENENGNKDENTDENTDGNTKYIFSVGFMQYSPNYLGVDRFLDEVWHKVREKYPDMKYKIAGKWAPKEYADKWNSIPGVEYLGFVKDLDELYEGALATVVAVDGGGGTCIKTLESLAYSRICLSRPFGARGLEKEAASQDCGLFVYETANDFLTLLDRYVMDPTQRKLSQHQGHQFVQQHYSESSFFEEVKQAFLK